MKRRAFTLVELLVVVTIVGGLVAILLPAIQVARETARRTSCQNNLRQLCVAIDLHRSATQRLPFGGWGHRWVGIPGRGSGVQQPGGWAYSILPFLELTDVHDLGLNAAGAEQEVAYTRRLTTPLPVFNCASRRACRPWQVAAIYSYAGSPHPSGQASEVARGDYAINGGASHVFSFAGPTTLEEGDDPVYWKNVSYAGNSTGVCHLRFAAKPSTFQDGLSKTYLVGEKMLEPSKYENGLSVGDNDSLYSGFSNDLHRFTGLLPSSRPWLPPLPDSDSNVDPPAAVRFGSAHSDGFNMAYCDGSVKHVEFGVDEEIHLRSGHRCDGGLTINDLK